MTPHVDDETWEQLAMCELGAPRRDEVLAHVAACATCSRIWLGLQAMTREARAFDPAVPVVPVAAPAPAADELGARRRRQSQILVGMGALAVAAAVLLVVVPAASREPDGRSRVERGAGGPGIDTRGPSTSPAGAPIALDWTPIATAESYRVTVYSDIGRVAFGPVEVASPPARIDGLVPGAYRWHVEAIAAGRPFARSALAPLAVRP